MPIVLPWEGNKPTFDQLLLVQDWSEEVLLELVRRRVQESLHLEYKDGLFVEPKDSKRKTRDAAGKLRRNVAGFANADGGVLVVGVAEDSREQGVPTGLSPITWKQPGGLLNWVRTSLSAGIYPSLTPSPEVFCVEADGEADKYLVIVVHPVREGLLAVRCNRPGNRSEVFPARLVDSTVDLDDWAVRYMLLGSRRQPRLKLTNPEPQVSLSRLSPDDPSVRSLEGDQVYDVGFRLRLSNTSLFGLTDLTWGLVSPIPAWHSNRTAGEVVPWEEAEHGRVRLAEPMEEAGSFDCSAGLYHLQHPSHPHARLTHLAPLGTEWLSFSLYVFGRCTQLHSPGQLLDLALYVVGSNMLPVWYEVRLRERMRDGVTIVERVVETCSPISLGYRHLRIPKGRLPDDLDQ